SVLEAGNRWRAAPPHVGVVDPAVKCTSSARLLPGMCCAVVVAMAALSYQPRPANELSSKFSCSKIVSPPLGGAAVIVTVAVSANVPPLCAAITRYVPAVCPAVYRPALEIVPP